MQLSHEGLEARVRVSTYPALTPDLLAHYLGSRTWRGRHPLPAPLGGALRTHLYFWGRGAIWSGLEIAGIGRGDTVLLPAYHCGAEIDPFVKRGVTVKFYPVGRSLLVDVDRLRALVDHRTRLLFVTHYFGFPQPMRTIVDFCRARGLFLMEDCAHALYSRADGRDLGSFGDVSIFSVRKSLPTPGGAALVVNTPSLRLPDPTRRASRRKTLGMTKGLLASYLIQRYGDMGRLAVRSAIEPMTRLSKSLRGPAGKAAEALDHSRHIEYEKNQGSWAMPSIAEWMLRTTDPAVVREVRRRNFMTLLGHLEGLARTSILYDSLPEGVCPLFFPLVVDDPHPLRERLQRHGIDANLFWSLFHPALPRDAFKEEVYLKEHVLGLPVHQGVTPAGLARMAALIREHLKGPREGATVSRPC